MNIVDAVDYDNGRLVCLSRAALEPGATSSIGLPGREQPVGIEVKSCRPLGDGRFLVVGQVLSGLAADESVSTEAPAHQSMRRAPRVPHRSRAVSRELPNYLGLTLDCSLSGIQLQSDGPLPVGQVIELNLDLEENHPAVHCHARVAWCMPAGDHFRSGMEFVHPSPRLTEALKHVMEGDHADVPRPSLSARVSTPHLRPVLHEERISPLPGTLLGYRFEGRDLHVEVLQPDKQVRTVILHDIRSVKDRRGEHGLELGSMAFSERPGSDFYRILNPANQAVLEVDAAPHNPELPRAGRRIKM